MLRGGPWPSLDQDPQAQGLEPHPPTAPRNSVTHLSSSRSSERETLATRPGESELGPRGLIFVPCSCPLAAVSPKG